MSTTAASDDTNLNWVATPAMDARDFHNVGGQDWSYNNRGVCLRSAPTTPLRSPNDPVTVLAIIASYGEEICKAAIEHQVPPELIVMTIATETAIFRSVNFTGPRTFRWESGVTSYSAGPMQVLETTARDLITKFGLNLVPPPHFSSKPFPPAANPLYDGEMNIRLGTAYIRQNKAQTGLDPIFVAAAYNAGSLRHTAPSPRNPWGLVSTGDHLNRAAEWFGDACLVFEKLRAGDPVNTGPVISGPATVDPEEQDPIKDFALRNLTLEEADEQTHFYEDSGATVIRMPEEGGFFTLIVSYREPIAVPPTNGPSDGGTSVVVVTPPDMDGFVICLERRTTQRRKGKGFDRTVGQYQAFFNRAPIPGLCGTAVERQGKGDNTNKGVTRHARIAQGTYPLSTHSGLSNKYKTFGFANPGGLRLRPWPSIRVDDTKAREGILIHCAAGYIMSIGCINLSSHALSKPIEDMEFLDSRARVIDLIQSMQKLLGSLFPNQNNKRIVNAHLVIRGEP
jgi:hypothetical protein